jgi:hypothetical protein
MVLWIESQVYNFNWRHLYGFQLEKKITSLRIIQLKDFTFVLQLYPDFLEHGKYLDFYNHLSIFPFPSLSPHLYPSELRLILEVLYQLGEDNGLA